MNTNEIIVQNTEYDSINPCNCSTCRRCARKLALRTAGTTSVNTVVLLLLACFLLQAQATACGSLPEAKLTHPGRNHQVFVDHTLKDTSSIDHDFYQSSDNPFRAD